MERIPQLRVPQPGGSFFSLQDCWVTYDDLAVVASFRSLRWSLGFSGNHVLETIVFSNYDSYIIIYHFLGLAPSDLAEIINWELVDDVPNDVPSGKLTVCY